MDTPSPDLPWLTQLHQRLDALERALLQGDAPAAERASEGVHNALKQAPARAERFDGAALQSAAQRLAQLRSAMHRAAALNERALGSLLPDHLQKPTYQVPGQAGARRAALR
jgi:hypothetical protein